jgi:hypothetical protein
MTEGGPQQVPLSLLTAAISLHADAVAAEVGGSLSDAGIPCILLRGRSIARHLYGRDETRGYGDADLLIREAWIAKAEEVLRRLSFRDVTGLGRRPSDRPPWSSTWERDRDGGNVDLHWTLVGAHAPPDVVWNVLDRQAERLEVARRDVLGLNAPATAMIIALHAAQHGMQVERVRDDLARALSQFGRETWQAAARLAQAIDALAAYGFGLRLLPEGAELANHLLLPKTASVEAILRSEDAPPTALGFDWLSQTPGLFGKARLIAGKIVPDRAFMRVWFAPARGGSSLGLALGYAWRPVWLLWRAPGGLRSWLSARRIARSNQPTSSR